MNCLGVGLTAGLGRAATPAEAQGPAQAQEDSAKKSDDRKPIVVPQDQDDRPTPQAPLIDRDKQIQLYDPLYRDPKAGDDPRVAKPADAADQKKAPEAAADKPIPGSLAEYEKNAKQQKNPNAEQDAQSDQHTEFAGPAVLSRTYAISEPIDGRTVHFAETFSIASTYNSGVVQLVPGATASAAKRVLEGTTMSYSIGGSRKMKRNAFNLSYTGSYAIFPGASSYTGLNQALTGTWSRILTRRFSLHVTGTGSTTSVNDALTATNYGPGTVANANLATSPNTTLFDSGTKRCTTATEVTYQFNTRLSFNAGVSYFGLKRDNPLLEGLTGAQASGDVTYRLTRKLTVGATYAFNHYVYPHAINDSYSRSQGIVVSYAIDRLTQIRLRAGTYSVETLGLQAVQIAPPIAAILGITTGIEDVYTHFSSGDFSGQFIRDFRRKGTMSFSYARGVSPGNGLLQTSRQSSLALSFSRTLLRTYGLTLGASQDHLASIGGDTQGQYKTTSVTAGVSRTFRRGVAFTLSFAYRNLGDTPLTKTGTNQFSISTGFSWSNTRGTLLPF